MKSIISDMFFGLSKIKMSRVRFFVYQMLLLSIVFTMTKLLNVYTEISFSQLLLIMLALLVISFVTLNTTAKRLRDVGTSQAWLLTIALLVITTVTLRNIDNDYVIYSVDLFLILFLTALPKDFINNNH